jgi:hypothetical protein
VDAAPAVLTRIAHVIDAHDWDALSALLHDEFVCRLVHTGETFDRSSWVRFNADYPGFDRLELMDLVGAGERAASRAHVTGYVDDELRHYEVAGFLTTRDGLAIELTEVWTDVDQAPPPGTRPS